MGSGKSITNGLLCGGLSGYEGDYERSLSRPIAGASTGQRQSYPHARPDTFRPRSLLSLCADPEWANQEFWQPTLLNPFEVMRERLQGSLLGAISRENWDYNDLSDPDFLGLCKDYKAWPGVLTGYFYEQPPEQEGVNPPFTEAQLEDLKQFKEKVNSLNNPIFDLIVELPEIAEREGRDALAENDKIGWGEYLPYFLRHWLLSKRGGTPRPVYISWDQMMSYKRIQTAYERFILPAGPGYVFSKNGMKSLYEVLRKNGYMEGKGKTFSFINAKPEDWGKYYFNHSPVKDLTLWPDGAYASLAGFTFRSIANGRTERLPNGTYRIYVSELGIYIRDTFNFEDLGLLGCWSKKMMDFGFPFPFMEYKFLLNSDMRKFSEATGRGENFEIISMPHRVKRFKPFYYDVQP